MKACDITECFTRDIGIDRPRGTPRVPDVHEGESGVASPSRAAFAPTEWSVVLDARSDSAKRRQALERLCRTYWRPLYAYIRRRGHGPADAEDLTQGFFAYLLESDFLDRPDPERGRFRGYLVGALKRYLGSHFERERAAKRGGGVQFIDWASARAEQEFSTLSGSIADACQAYETSWALTLLACAMRRLEEEQIGEEKQRRFAVLKPFLTSPPQRGDYDRAAGELNARRTSVAVWVYRLAERFSEIVRLEVMASVRDPADVPAELAHLATILRR